MSSRYHFQRIEARLSAITLNDIQSFMPDSGAVREWCDNGQYAVFAGQAVSSAVMQLLGLGNGPINDYDIFTGKIPPDYVIKKMEALRQANGETYSDCSFFDEYNMDDLAMPCHLDPSSNILKNMWRSSIEDTLKYRYSIKCTESEGNLNIIYIQFAFPILSSKAFALKTIQGFDLNCCQVGVDLQTESLIYTDAFVEYVIKRKLKVMTAFTPVNTVFRLLRKKHDLRHVASVDMDKELRMLGAMLLCKTKRVSTWFNHHTLNKNGGAIKTSGTISTVADDRFRVVPVANVWRPLWTLEVLPEFQQDIRLMLEQSMVTVMEDDDGLVAPLPLERLASSPNTYPDNFRLLFGADSAIQCDKTAPHQIVRHSSLRRETADEFDALLFDE